MKFVPLFLFVTLGYGKILEPSCYNPIYCYGDILHTIQMARIYKDGKHFVDLKMKHSDIEILNNFEKLQNENNHSIPIPELEQFLLENFEDGNELENHTLSDFNPDLHFIKYIHNETVKKFTKDLLQIWPQLARKVKEEVFNNVKKYSFIPVPHAFIIPGGRFREYYYWDSYWIIDGLLISEMYETARGMIDNFLSLVEQIGFIPNGGRVYYLKRSQPALLTAMADAYYQHTGDINWIRENIETLVKELKYWDSQSVPLKKRGRMYKLYQYNAISDGPRPESYREDYETASNFKDKSRKQQLYIDLKSGAESGWDFSNRWIFDAQGGNQANLSLIQTTRVIPVDLNAFLCGAFKSVANFYSTLGDITKSTYWHNKFVEIRKAIDAVLWNEADGIWYDYDLRLAKHRAMFYPTNVSPLWSKCFQEENGSELGKRVLEYLEKEGIFSYLGGIPSSLDHTGQQWDFPNAWAPLQDIVVRGLENSKYLPAHYKASELATNWVNSNILGFQKTGAMFEKYDAVVPGQYGGGGEYEVQSGFGWTNGVVLRFIYDYYRQQ